MELTYLSVAIASTAVAYLAFRFGKDKKIEKDATMMATVLTKLDNIIATVAEIRIELKNQEKTNGAFSIRLTVVEESMKQLRREFEELREND